MDCVATGPEVCSVQCAVCSVQCAVSPAGIHCLHQWPGPSPTLLAEGWPGSGQEGGVSWQEGVASILHLARLQEVLPAGGYLQYLEAYWLSASARALIQVKPRLCPS